MILAQLETVLSGFLRVMGQGLGAADAHAIQNRLGLSTRCRHAQHHAVAASLVCGMQPHAEQRRCSDGDGRLDADRP